MASKQNKQYMNLVAWVGFLVVLAIAGCRMTLPRQSWDQQRGPLVPHNKFPGDCGICHLPDQWDVLRDDFSFDHEKEAGYRLEGAHDGAACLLCHNDFGPVEAYVARGCSGCHQDPHAASLGMDCERCHNQFSWAPSGLVGEHARTRFPLMGAHAIAACDSCHEGAPAGDFRGAPLQCEICHRNDAAQTTDPSHVANGWLTGCERCHNQVDWMQLNIQHDFFPLEGGHSGLDCTACHVGGIFTGLTPDCYSCHADEYQIAPDHVAQNYSHDCQQCHTTTFWSQIVVNHSFFPLKGGHSGLSCSQCHEAGTFTGLSPDCYSCHDADYQSAPDHAAQNYPHDCQQCHSRTAWLPAVIDHSFFPLKGGHSALSCSQCHVAGTFSGLSPDCYSCHDADYQSAPDHAAQNYPHDCLQCHSRTAWLPAVVDHSFFPLSGGHSGVSCNQCHVGNTFTGLSQDCYSCHASDYQAAPDHASLGFPHDCLGCHSKKAWLPASFSHTSFPLSGNHNVSCTECHTTGSTQTFDCLQCHAHAKSGTDSHHSDVRSYSYNSSACYFCHRNGQAGD